MNELDPVDQHEKMIPRVFSFVCFLAYQSSSGDGATGIYRLYLSPRNIHPSTD